MLGLDEENIRERVIKIGQGTAPDCRGKLPKVFDSVYRLGHPLQEGRPRAVIVQFSMRRYCDSTWKAAKNLTYLREKKQRFKEDFSLEDRASRNLLWPLVERARKDGRIAYFIGARACITECWKKKGPPPTKIIIRQLFKSTATTFMQTVRLC